jgi:hypothetical protein
LNRVDADGSLGWRLKGSEEDIYEDLTSISLSRKALTFTAWYPYDVQDKWVVDLMSRVSWIPRRVRK